MDTLWQLLVGYFGYQSLDEGIDQMLFVTEDNQEYHQKYLDALHLGIAAAEQGDDKIVPLLINSNAVFVEDAAEALEFLTTLHDTYLERYKIVTGVTKRNAKWDGALP